MNSDHHHSSPSPASPIGSPVAPLPLDLPHSLNGIPLDESGETNEMSTNETPIVAGSTAGQLKSVVWNHFDREKVDGKWKAKCKQCSRSLLDELKQGTSHLKNHLQRCPRRKTTDIRQKVLQANSTKGNFGISPFNFDQEASRNELAKMIILHEYPLSIVDHEGFRNFCKSLNPCFKIVSRNTIKSDCLKIYNLEKEATMHILERIEGRVALTTDMWTSSCQKKGFMVVTAHYVDNNWRLQSRIIRFIYVPCPHTSEVLCEALLNCFLDWNIDRKLSTITVDNCSTNDAMLDLLMEKLSSGSLLLEGKLIHMRCCAHILNLVVKDGLEVIEGAIENIRESVAYWSGTQKRWEKFEDTARQLRITIGKKLILDCKTRWNSTFLMLQTAIDYKDVFFRLKHREPKYKCLPSEGDWALTKEICSRLKLFYTATELFSGTKYPTANLYFPKICEIKVALTEWLRCGIDTIELMSVNMLKKFDNAEYEVENILKLSRDLLQQYEDKERSKGDSDMSAMEMNSSVDEMVSLSEFDLYASKKKRKYVKSELDQYLDEHILPRTSDFDVLSWWKSNKGKYPILHQIAREVLAIPVSTVASESAFSTSGRVIGPHRSRLHPNTVEALMCAQNWLLADMKDPSSDEHAHATVFDDSDSENDEVAEG